MHGARIRFIVHTFHKRVPDLQIAVQCHGTRVTELYLLLPEKWGLSDPDFQKQKYTIAQ